MWMILPTWKYSLYASAIILGLILFIRRRTAQRLLAEAPPATHR